MDDLFFMTSLGSKSTGLPFPVWVSCGKSGTTRQEIAVWIGDRNPPVPSEMTYLEVGSEVRLIRGSMSDANLDLLRTWIALNAEALRSIGTVTSIPLTSSKGCVEF